MKNNKALKITVKVIMTIVLVIVMLLALVKVGERLFFTPFYSNAQAEFKIPGLGEGYIPQGLEKITLKDNDENDCDYFLACGYMNNHSASRVYLLDRWGNVISQTYLKEINSQGEIVDYTGHTGGICVNYAKDLAYISGSGGLDIFKLSDIVSTEKNEAVLVGEFKVSDKVDPAYCKINGDYLYAGSFHHAGPYDTDEKQHFETQSGETNMSVILKYKLDNSAEFGISSKLEAIYSTPSYVQGIAFTDKNELILSCSWGLSISKLHVHDLEKVHSYNSLSDESDWGTSVPVYYVDSLSNTYSISAPPMAEEIVVFENRIWIMNESACNKYIFGKFTSGSYLFSYGLN